MTKYKNDQMRNLLDLTGALSDENRIRILMLLDHAELCVCQITAVLSLAPSTISKHLSILENSGLISRRKDGRWVFYRLNNSNLLEPGGGLFNLIKKSVSGNCDILNDRKKIKALLKEDVNAVCKRLYHDDDSESQIRGRINGSRKKAQAIVSK